MKIRILRRSKSPDSVLQLGLVCKMSLGVLADIAKQILDSPHPEMWEEAAASDEFFKEDMTGGIRAMTWLAESPDENLVLRFREANYALRVCCFLCTQPRMHTPRLKTMLREALSIFSECNYVSVRASHIPPFGELDPALKKVPVVRKHYPEIEALSGLDGKVYVMAQSEAIELLQALNGTSSAKTVLLKNQLEVLTVEVRSALASVQSQRA